MRTWEKPELIVEDFELEQHVAHGCEMDLPELKPEKPGAPVILSMGCTKDGVPMNGNGHWDSTVPVYDANGNGKIDWAEFVKYQEKARNDIQTGQGHDNHRFAVLINNKPVYPESKPFTS